jgi:hypothetical protein
MVMSGAGACSNLLQSLAIMAQPGVVLLVAAFLLSAAASGATSGDHLMQKRDGIVLIRIARWESRWPVTRKITAHFFRITRPTTGNRRCWDRQSPA